MKKLVIGAAAAGGAVLGIRRLQPPQAVRS